MKKLLTCLMLLSLPLSAMAEDQFSLSTGFDYSSGKYGNAASTDILYIPVTGKYESDRLTLKLTVPYISISGPGGVTRGMGRFGQAVTRTTRITHSGLGDVVTSAGYTIYDGGDLAFDLVGKVKLGTASSKNGLGTGKNDYSAQIDGYYSLGQSTLFATAGYTNYGAPVGVTLKNSPYGTLGLSRKLNSKTSAGAMLDVAKSPNSTSANQREITAFVSQKITANLKVQANVLKGFSNGSPNFGGGLMVTGTF